MKRVLCIEDQKTWHTVLRRLFRSIFDEVIIVSTRLEAIDILRKYASDLELITVNLNLDASQNLDHQGYELLAFIQLEYPHLRKIIITGHDKIFKDSISLRQKTTKLFETYKINDVFFKKDLKNPTALKQLMQIVALPEENDLLDPLKDLIPGQFAQVMFKCNVSDTYISQTLTQVEKAIMLIRFVSGQGKLSQLRDAIRDIRI